MKIITAQLSKFLEKDHILQKYHHVDPTSFNEIYDLFQSESPSSICIYDKTFSNNLKIGQIIPIRDHINNTGENILIGQQKRLNIDFTDATNLYQQKHNGRTTVCCGKTLNIEKKYPSHYICHITILARTMKIKTIDGYLYNIKR